MSKTAIPELITGTIALIPTVWLGWITIYLQRGVYELYQLDNTTGGMALKISSATLVFVWALFMLIAVWCYLIVLERVVIWIIRYIRRNWKDKDTL